MTRAPEDIHQHPIAGTMVILAMVGAAVLLLFYPEKLQAWTIDWYGDRHPFPQLLRSGFAIGYYRFIGMFVAVMLALVVYGWIHPG